MFRSTANILIAILFFSAAHVFAYADSSVTAADTSGLTDLFIGKIIIAGNDITDDDVIEREIQSQPDSPLDLKLLEQDVSRVYNLGLFNKVDVYPIQTDTVNKVNVLFVVEERFYIIPLPQGGFRNGEFKKFWAGMNIQWKNFRGRNETAALSFGIGYEPFVNFSYTVPWIGRFSHFYSSVDVSYSKNYNRSLYALNDTVSNTIPSSDSNFTIHNFHVSYELGKYFSHDLSASFRLGYNVIHTSKYEPGRTLSSDGNDNFLSLDLNGNFDTRDSKEYTLAGSYYDLRYQRFGFGRYFDFNRLNLEAKKFVPIIFSDKFRITFASKFLFIVSFGRTIPYYLDEYYGYDKIIRGYKKIVFEGENQFGSFNEFRIPIINPFYVQGQAMPAVNKIAMLKKLNYKFGLYATLFFDIGTVWEKKDNFFGLPFHNGFGTGLNFILPFGLVGRTDFAFRVEKTKFYPQIIFDLDAAF